MNEDERLREALNESAAKLDAAEPPACDFAFFKKLVEKQQAVARRAQRRQLALFVVVAALLVSVIITGMGWSLAFVVALQGAAVAGAITGLTVFFLRSRRAKAAVSR